MFTRKDVEHLAKLARLKLEDAEVERYQRELDAILGYVSKLQEVELKESGNAEGVSGRTLELRADDPGVRPFRDDPGAACAALLSQFPVVKHDFLVVPKVLEKET